MSEQPASNQAKRGVAMLTRVNWADRAPCGWEMSAEKYGRCSKCGREWANFERPNQCVEVN